MRYKVLILALLLTNSLLGGTIKVAVAANVSYAIEELKTVFEERNSNIKIDVILGSSGKLTSQIRQGAPFALFLSANMNYPQALYDEGKATQKPVMYAQGVLAFLSNKKRNSCKEETVLNDDDIKKIAISNPKTAPYGVATVEALKNAKLYAKHKEKFVYGESASQTVFYATMAADIGIVAASSLYSPQLAQYHEGIHWWELDEELYTPISQGMVMIGENKDAKVFYDFILSLEAKNIFKKYGYKVEE
ncbi:molybdate ABC transporter substrate-binding protein [Sulfurovum sp.]|uniref:molybdate ABC transporter substrate-binding protein n=1 Tax=Sulfurovum sp. TaxID=1969726 RepID=UPI002867FE02|nr:molybdate ABC transporter substrate-binding protein [Sulfurovum sp.]